MRIVALAAAAMLGSATLAAAQAVPAETPPLSYTGVQYVDSRGCIFVRVGVGANVDWVPRVGRDRRQICGQSPTQIARTAPETAPTAAAAPAPTRPATTASRPAAVAPAAIRPVATTPRPVATTQRPVPAPAVSGNCPNLPADVQQYFTGPDVRCGPQAVHPGDAARGLDRTGALQDDGAIRQVVRYEVDPPPGYRAAWDDGRMNPYRGLAFAGGQRQMEQVWTNTVPRRLVTDPPPRGLRALFTRPSQPAETRPARLVVIRP